MQTYFFLWSQSLYFGYFSILTTALGNPPTMYVPVGVSCPFPLRSGFSTALKQILADETFTKHLTHTYPNTFFFFHLIPSSALTFFSLVIGASLVSNI